MPLLGSCDTSSTRRQSLGPPRASASHYYYSHFTCRHFARRYDEPAVVGANDVSDGTVMMRLPTNRLFWEGGGRKWNGWGGMRGEAQHTETTSCFDCFLLATAPRELTARSATRLPMSAFGAGRRPVGPYWPNSIAGPLVADKRAYRHGRDRSHDERGARDSALVRRRWWWLLMKAGSRHKLLSRASGARRRKQRDRQQRNGTRRTYADGGARARARPLV